MTISHWPIRTFNQLCEQGEGSRVFLRARCCSLRVCASSTSKRHRFRHHSARRSPPSRDSARRHASLHRPHSYSRSRYSSSSRSITSAAEGCRRSDRAADRSGPGRAPISPTGATMACSMSTSTARSRGRSKRPHPKSAGAVTICISGTTTRSASGATGSQRRSPTSTLT